MMSTKFTRIVRFLRVAVAVSASSCFDFSGSVPSTRAVSDASAFTRNLGVVDPGSAHHVQFEIYNDSDIPWTFREIITSCRCTVAKPRRPRVSPDSYATVDVDYKASLRPRDDRQNLAVRFAERDAPVLTLSVTAQVRPSLYIVPPRIDFGVSPLGSVEPVSKPLNDRKQASQL